LKNFDWTTIKKNDKARRDEGQVLPHMLRSDHRELLVVRQGTFSITKTWYRYLVLVRAVE